MYELVFELELIRFLTSALVYILLNEAVPSHIKLENNFKVGVIDICELSKSINGLLKLFINRIY